MRKYLVLLALAGCGSSTTSVDNLDDFEGQIIQIDCDFLIGCCGSAWATAKYGAPANCVSMGLAAYGRTSGMTNAAIAAGTVRFDAAAANACLDWHHANLSACDNPIVEVPDSCRDILDGLLPLGATCANLTDGSKCAPSLYCGASGTCVPLPIAGQACSDSDRCAGGNVCLPSGSCGMPLAAGQPCVDNQQCSSDNCPSNMSSQVCSASPRRPNLASICK